jgi:hypothetical protein
MTTTVYVTNLLLLHPFPDPGRPDQELWQENPQYIQAGSTGFAASLGDLIRQHGLL